MQTKVNYFYGCESIEEVKVRFKKLAKTLHPDTGGSHNEFIDLKKEYDTIIDRGTIISETPVSPADYLTKFYNPNRYKTTNLTPDELNKIKADNHFNNLRQLDKTYDIIDDMLERAVKERLRTLWIFQEVSKLLELELNHFKYVTYKTNNSTSIASQLYKKYLGI